MNVPNFLRASALLAALALAAGEARAELPPRVYEEAREKAETVVLVEVSSVTRADRASSTRDAAACTLEGRAAVVERGPVAVGDRVRFRFPCVTRSYVPRPGPFPGYSLEALRNRPRLKVWATGDVVVPKGIDDAPAEP